MSDEINIDGIELPDPEILNEEELTIAIDTILVEAGKNLTRRGKAINEVCELIYKIDDPVQQSVFIADVSRKHKITKKVLIDKIRTLTESANTIKVKNLDEELDSFYGIDKAVARKLGFFEHKSSYYFITKDGLFRGSNFVVHPLFHIYSKSDNKRLVEIENEFGYKRIIDIPSKSFITVDQFQQYVYNEGNFIFFGTKVHFMKILEHVSNKFPVCNELKTLGWQREGFYAFANGIYSEGKWQPVDDFGITTHGKTKYFSAAFSTVYSDVREDDDDYESDRYFIWRQSPITFGTWSKLMIDVYGDNAKIGIAFAIASCFRDLIYEKYKIFPHLFLFGEKQSGKSQFAWSLSNLFFANMPAFNLNSGTQVGFFRRFSRIKNSINWLDEFTNDVDPRRQQAMKSAYDGMGHEKGKMTKDNRTEITKVNSAGMISGQFLPTSDDNALFTRSILLSFIKKIYSAEEIEKYDLLKKYELEGISSLIGDIIDHRAIVDRGFSLVFSELMDKIKYELIQSGKSFEERLVRNFCCILAPVKIILESENPLELNFTFEDIYELSKLMISALTLQISSSESLANFWQMTEYLLDNKMIENGNDFEIKSITSVRVTNKKEIAENLSYNVPKVVLFIRFSKIHPLYMEGHRRQFGKNGVDLVSLMHYIKHHPSYIGAVKSYRFDNSVSSCYCFDYETLNANLERNARIPGEEDRPF